MLVDEEIGKFAHFVAFPGSFEMVILCVFLYMYLCVIKSLMRNREWCYAIFFIVEQNMKFIGSKAKMSYALDHT